MAVHVLLAGHPGVDVPAELVDHVAVWQKGDSIQGEAKQEVYIGLLV